MMRLFFCLFALLSALPSATWARLADWNTVLHPPFSVGSEQPHRVRLLQEGTSAFNQILELIHEAEHSIDMEYFIFRSDMAGKLITQALIKKALAGVKVRILLDHSSFFVELNDIFAQRLQKFGIEVKYFNRSLPMSPRDLIWRNHRKLLVVDHQKAILGGRNVADEYFDQNETYNFLDRDIFVDGPIVSAMSKSFNLYWGSKEASRPRPKVFAKTVEGGVNRLKKLIDNIDSFFQEDRASRARWLTHQIIGRPLLKLSPFLECKEVIFAFDRPSIPKKAHVPRLFQALLKNSTELIMLETPYFSLQHRGYKGLMDFLHRGGNVQLLTNGLYSTDVTLVHSAFLKKIREPIENGAEIYVYGGRRPEYPLVSTKASSAIWGIHSKTGVFDGKHTLVSSFNLDARSEHFNHELAFVCLESPEVASRVASNIQTRIKRSALIDRNGRPSDERYPYMQTSFLKKVGLWMATPFLPIFEDFL